MVGARTPPGDPEGNLAWFEEFGAYLPEQTICGDGGWEVWHSGGANAFVDGVMALSRPGSLRLVRWSDVVRPLPMRGGAWELRLRVFVPSTLPPGAGASIILLNRYGTVETNNWSLQIALNETSRAGSQQAPYMVESQWDGHTLPLVMDEWVEIRAEIDLERDRWRSWYAGQTLTPSLSWTSNGFGTGPGERAIAAINLWSNAEPVYIDDISLVPLEGAACYADCDGSGGVDVLDLICFQTLFAIGSPASDCDADGMLGVGDLVCFQTRMALGC